MSLHRLATLAEYGWLAAVVAAHGAVLGFCLWDDANGASTVGNFAAEIVPLVQLAILPLWLMLGPGSKRVRWIAIPLFFGLQYLWSGLPYPREGTQAWWLALEVAGLLLAMSLALRLCGQRVRNSRGVAESIPPVQFSIRGLLIATTLAALLVMGGKWVFEHVEFAAKNDKPDLLDLNPLIARAAVAGGLAFVSLVSWWAVFRPRRVWLTCLAIAAAAGGCGMLMTLLLHESDAWLSFGLWWLLHAAGMMGTLAPLRQMGFRMAARTAQKVAAAPMKMKSYGGKVPVTGVTS